MTQSSQQHGRFASGVPYDHLEPAHMVVVDLEGNVVEDDLRPSSDAATHLVLYRSLKQIGVIVERFVGLDPAAMPAVLVAGHAPFTWGSSAAQAVENAVALEAVAEMAIGSWLIDRHGGELEPYILEKHYQRKHGPAAYYGQQ